MKYNIYYKGDVCGNPFFAWQWYTLLASTCDTMYVNAPIHATANPTKNGGKYL